VAKYVLHKKAY